MLGQSLQAGLRVQAQIEAVRCAQPGLAAGAQLSLRCTQLERLQHQRFVNPGRERKAIELDEGGLATIGQDADPTQLKLLDDDRHGAGQIGNRDGLVAFRCGRRRRQQDIGAADDQPPDAELEATDELEFGGHFDALDVELGTAWCQRQLLEHQTVAQVSGGGRPAQRRDRPLGLAEGEFGPRLSPGQPVKSADQRQNHQQEQHQQRKQNALDPAPEARRPLPSLGFCADGWSLLLFVAFGHGYSSRVPMVRWSRQGLPASSRAWAKSICTGPISV